MLYRWPNLELYPSVYELGAVTGQDGPEPGVELEFEDSVVYYSNVYPELEEFTPFNVIRCIGRNRYISLFGFGEDNWLPGDTCWFGAELMLDRFTLDHYDYIISCKNRGLTYTRVVQGAPAALGISGGRWFFEVSKSLGNDNSAANLETTTYDLGHAEPGEWLDWIFRIAISRGDDGEITLWKNGVEVMRHLGANFYSGEVPSPDSLTGLYQRIGLDEQATKPIPYREQTQEEIDDRIPAGHQLWIKSMIQGRGYIYEPEEFRGYLLNGLPEPNP